MTLKRTGRIKHDPVKAAQRAERRAERREAEGLRPEDIASQARREAGERAHLIAAPKMIASCADCHPDPCTCGPPSIPWPTRKPTVPPKRRPVSPASTAQRAKRTASIVSGETRGLDPAHICPRSLGGCDHPDCVVPLTRAEHRAFDEADPRTGKRLDLLPYLVAHGCHAELAHALEHYRCDLIALLERVTGEAWRPVVSVQSSANREREDL